MILSERFLDFTGANQYFRPIKTAVVSVLSTSHGQVAYRVIN